MSKAVDEALAALQEAWEKDADKPPVEAVITVIREGMSFLERIAKAMEKQAGIIDRGAPPGSYS